MLNKETFQQSFQTLCPQHQEYTFLVAVSGGVDSMALLELCISTGLSVEAAHINYGLRGEDSFQDQLLVQKACLKNQIPLHIYEVSKKDQKPNNSIQEWARKIRYRFFREVKTERNLDFILTAHHLNDQLETFLINLSKAAGIKGLGGMPARENAVLRPLLGVTKEEIYEFAAENEIEFREDLSNQKNDYLRNRIRNTIAPHLLEINDHFLENFKKSITYLNQTKKFVEDKINELEKSMRADLTTATHLDKKLLFAESDFVQYEILRKYGFNDSTELEKIKNAEAGKTFVSADYQLTVDRTHFVIEKKQIKEPCIPAEKLLEKNAENEIIFPSNINQEIRDFGSCRWEFDGDRVSIPLKIRRKKGGDLFYPIGMIGKKKIGKFFKDEKIPILAQPKIWLLCDAEDHVLGVIPFRQDRRFAATKETTNIITVRT